MGSSTIVSNHAANMMKEDKILPDLQDSRFELTNFPSLACLQ
jgi:hypothetical protein